MSVRKASARKPSRSSAPIRALESRARIRFGTGGWRGVLNQEVTDERLRALVHGIATRLRARRASGAVLVGFDGRAASEHLAGLAAGVLRERGIAVVLDVGPSPTPALAGAVAKSRAAAALVLTASHNPPEYHGLKLFGNRGEAVGGDEARRIEEAAARALAKTPRRAAERGGLRRADFTARYVKRLARAIDLVPGGAGKPRVFYDALHGAGAGALDAALRECGVRITGLRLKSDSTFGGDAPDPSSARLRDLSRRVRAGRGLRLGLATDGDADRIAAVDEKGRVLGEGELAALVVDHLARSGRLTGGVALSLGSSSFVERVAARHGLVTARYPMGFKHLSLALLSEAAAIAVDESGGVAFSAFAPDKDGMFAGAMLVEAVALRGMGLGEQLRELRRECGQAIAGRTALRATPRRAAALAALAAAPPARFDGARVGRQDLSDGVRLLLEDGFVMWRASGTEPVIRVYAEGPDRTVLKRRLRLGEARLGSGR